MASLKQKRRVASYIGSGAADPIGWTQVAPGTAAPGGQVYVTSAGPPLRYQINPNGTYVTQPA
jgi:hypothetical protein